MEQKKTLTRKQFAQALQVSEALVRKWQRHRKIRVVRFGRCVRIPTEELSRVVSSGIN